MKYIAEIRDARTKEVLARHTFETREEALDYIYENAEDLEADNWENEDYYLNGQLTAIY